MFKRGMTICLVLAMATVAQAGAVISLTPESVGPYAAGATVVVDVSMAQDAGGADRYLRLHQFDFGGSDTALSLDSFAFDWSGSSFCADLNICDGSGHEKFPSLTDADGAIVSAAFTASSLSTLFQVKLPGDGSSITLGQLTLTLPSAEGLYMLDALNASTNDPGNGSAALNFGFGTGPGDEITRWTGAGGDVTGGLLPFEGSVTDGLLTFEVIPEPATLALLAIGGIATLRRRRTA